jgi:integrase
LLVALPVEDRALWATAMYAGLRRGELQALQVQAVKLDEGVIGVTHGWDRKEGRIDTKGRRRRKAPIPAVLRELLAADLLRTGRRGTDLMFGHTSYVFGEASHTAFAPNSVRQRAIKAWKKAKLKPITLHECRHTAVSYLIAAGVNPKAISSAMGHSSVAFTFDSYGHLFEGSEREAAGLIDTYLGKAAAGS